MSATLSIRNTTPTMRMLLVLLSFALAAAGCASTDGRQSTGEYVDDAAVTTKVKTAFIRDDEVDAIDINVKTFKGVVQLSGFADTDQERRRAESIAGRIAGVERVQNDIRIN